MPGQSVRVEPALAEPAAVALVGEAGAGLEWVRVAGCVEVDGVEVAREPAVGHGVVVVEALAGADAGLSRLAVDEGRRRADGGGQERVLVDCSRPRVEVSDGAIGTEVEGKVECLGGVFVAGGVVWQRRACSEWEWACRCWTEKT